MVLLLVPGGASAAEPVLSAPQAIVVDAATGDTLFARDARARHPIASTTKLMTALLVLERASLQDRYAAVDYSGIPAESVLGLHPGEEMQVSDLLRALLLASANDAAATLATGLAGSEDAFVETMNRRAQQLGLRDTSYDNPIGLDAPGNYSSARDLATLARRLLRNRRFARIVDSPEATLESGSHVRVVQNRNDLVAAYPWVNGVKTGYTSNAGNVLVGSAARGPRARVISVVMGESTEAARDADTLTLLRWGLDRFTRVRVIARGHTFARPDVKYRDEPARLVARRGVVVTVRDGQHLDRRVNAPDDLEGPLAKGERVGSVTVVVAGKRVRRVALVTAEEVPGAGTLRVLLSDLGVPLTVLIALAILAAAILAMLRYRIRIRIAK